MEGIFHSPKSTPVLCLTFAAPCAGCFVLGASMNACRPDSAPTVGAAWYEVCCCNFIVSVPCSAVREQRDERAPRVKPALARGK